MTPRLRRYLETVAAMLTAEAEKDSAFTRPTRQQNTQNSPDELEIRQGRKGER